MHGTIRELVLDRGFGFIADQDGREYFFHRGALMGVEFEDLTAGQEVEFMARPPEAGDEPGEHPRAVSIRLAADAQEAPDHERLARQKTG
jgi:cold shock CspA family protein